MNISAACPPLTDLTDFLLGRITETNAVRIEHHLADCASCRERLSTLPAEDDLVRQLRSQARQPDSTHATVNERLEGAAGESTRPLETGQAQTTVQLPNASPAEAASLDWQALGQRIFRPVNFHRRGGLGEVYVAEDSELGRQVALKRMQRRFQADPRQRQEFVREAEITGLLEHPGVVPVYGLVQDAAGNPCYAMRFIEGESLKDALERFHAAAPADHSSLEFRQLLGRFIAVCNTIGYAHSRGIIHRDLKPANIMLGKYGETLVVDWGLARKVEQQEPARVGTAPVCDTDATLTRQGSLKGTIGYMSPEQASGAWDTVGPAADIFSLGATLYDILTGRPPYAGKDGLRQARQGEFPPPRQLRPSVPAALEAICLKAMAVRPDARYASALDLAQELERWLADEPIQAHAEPLPVQAGRWLRKHPRLVAATTAMIFMAIVGLTAGALVMGEKNRELTQAYNAEQTERQRAEKNLALAQEREAQTRAVLGFVEERILAAARPKGQAGGLGRDVTLRQALDAALPFITPSFPNQPLIEAQLRMKMGNSLVYLGDAQGARAQLERARALYVQHRGPDDPDTLAAANNLANCYYDLGQHANALKLYEDTLARRKAKLGAEHLDTLTSMNNVANSYYAVGRAADAAKLYEETLALQKARLGPDDPDTLATTNNLANAYAALGRYADTLQLHTATLARMQTKFGPDHPTTLAGMNNVAAAHAELGQHGEAVKLYEKTLKLRKAKLGPDHPETLHTMNNLASSYAATGRAADAVKLREETLALRKAKLGADHPDTLASMHDLANSYGALGRPAEALKLREETLAGMKARLGPDHPETLSSMNNLAASYFAAGRAAEGIKLLEDTLALRKTRLGPDHPDTLTSMSNLAKTYQALGRHAEAVQLEESMLTLRKSDRADTVRSLYNIACSHALLAAALGAEKSADAPKKADAEAQRAMDWLRQAVAAGYADLAQLKKDADLEVLRQRADFQQLLAELEKKAKP